MIDNNIKQKPSLSDFISIYPDSKKNRNIYKIWRWLVIGRLSLIISWLFSRINFSPNQVTYLSFLVGLTGLFFLISGGKENLIFGIFLINTWYLLDCSDGHLARFYKIESRLGKFLDEIFGEIVMIFLWISISIGLYKTPDFSIQFINNAFELNLNEYIILLGAICSISIPLKNSIAVRFSNNFISERKKINKISNRLSKYNWIKIFWTNFIGIGGLQGPLLLIASIFGFLGFLIAIYSLAYTFYLIISIIYFIKRFND